MKRLNDHSINELEQKFLRPMYNNHGRDHFTYDGFKDELFDLENVSIYICYVERSFPVGRNIVPEGATCVLRRLPTRRYELEICGKSTINTVILPLTQQKDLRALVESVLFRGEDFNVQPNPFGPNIRLRYRNGVQRTGVPGDDM